MTFHAKKYPHSEGPICRIVGSRGYRPRLASRGPADLILEILLGNRDLPHPELRIFPVTVIGNTRSPSGTWGS